MVVGNHMFFTFISRDFKGTSPVCCLTLTLMIILKSVHLLRKMQTLFEEKIGNNI